MLSGWHIEVNNPRQEENHYTAYIQRPVEEKNVQLWKMQDGKLIEINCVESGSYLMFEMDGDTADICLIGVSHNQKILFTAAAGVLVVGGLGIFIRNWHKKRKNKKTDKENRIEKEQKAG